MTTDTLSKADLHHITRLPSKNYRVRVQINGVWRGGVHDDPDFAIAERDALLTHMPPRRKHPWDPAEITRQKRPLPESETFRNIRFTKSGCFVQLGRGYGTVYGGHFSGPHAIAQAVARRDALELQYPSQQ